MLGPHRRIWGVSLVFMLVAVRGAWAVDTQAPRRPNIVLVMTDDQGYGELACHGNPILKTPNLDRLHARSLRFTAFHVSPTCAPTRASLMTGRHEFRSGVTHTIHERERLALDAVTLPSLLSAAGYQTGIFGKWHLGDEKPYRPAQRGFSESFIHGAGGIGQSYEGSCGDFPGNSYFNPFVLHNERVEPTQGYCTDVFFDAAIKWIEQNRQRPFFAYIPTNAPHSPFDVDDKYSQPYESVKEIGENGAAYYGMIANIDENIGKLVAALDALRLSENTLLIFMTDNGHPLRGLYNANMRGHKNTPYEGGTRVPAFFAWPGTLPAGVDVGALAAHIDLLPTFVELCGAKLPDVKLDGRSLVPLFNDPQAPWDDRYLFVHCGRWERGRVDASKYQGCAVRTQRFRLVNNKELYDIQADASEAHDVAADHPEIVADMQARYEAWWADIQQGLVNENAKLAPENPYAALFRQYRERAKASQ